MVRGKGRVYDAVVGGKEQEKRPARTRDQLLAESQRLKAQSKWLTAQSAKLVADIEALRARSGGSK